MSRSLSLSLSRLPFRLQKKKKKNPKINANLRHSRANSSPPKNVLAMALSAGGKAGLPLLLLLALVAASHLFTPASAAVVVSQTSDGWIRGRATFFDASDDFRSSFEKIRGEGSFGDLHYGSCGYFNKPQVRREMSDAIIIRKRNVSAKAGCGA